VQEDASAMKLDLNHQTNDHQMNQWKMVPAVMRNNHSLFSAITPQIDFDEQLLTDGQLLEYCTTHNLMDHHMYKMN
jgi:hypothetical protein